MSLFGRLDAANISSNAFFVAAGDYSATIVTAEYRTSRDDKRQLHFDYQIDDVESEYLDSKVSQYFDLPDLEMTEEMFELLPADEKKRMRKTNAAVKRTLQGSGREGQPGLGVTDDEMNDPEWDPKVLLNTKVNLSIYNYGPKNEGFAVKYVNKQED